MILKNIIILHKASSKNTVKLSTTLTNKMDFSALCEKYKLNMTEELLQTVLDHGNRTLVIPPQGAMYTITDDIKLPDGHVAITTKQLNKLELEVINLQRDSNNVVITNMEKLTDDIVFDTDKVHQHLSVDEWTVFVHVLRCDTYILRKSKTVDFTIDRYWLVLFERMANVQCAYAIKLHMPKVYNVA